MTVLKKKMARPVRPKRSRAEQSGYLKRFHGESSTSTIIEPTAHVEDAELPQVASQGSTNPTAESTVSQTVSTASMDDQGGERPALKVISKSRTTCLVEQRLVHSYGLGQPMVTLKLRLSTAVRGQRNQEGCIEVGYLFRLEVLQASPAIQVEGFSLGPWRAERVSMDVGNIFVADPLWAAFQAHTGRIHGRILLLDVKRKCVLDLPWETEALVPGPEPHAVR